MLLISNFSRQYSSQSIVQLSMGELVEIEEHDT